MPRRMFRLVPPLWLILTVLAAGCHIFAQPPPPTGAPASGPSENDVVYGVAAGEKLLMDIYRCDTPGLHPALVMIHGGGWRSGDKAGDRGTAVNLSTKAGITCFSLNYRLAPKYQFPAQVLDCARAVRWVRAHAKDYAVDPGRIAAWGGSAGGHLSLMLGVMKPDDYPSPDDPNRALSAKVQYVVDFFGPSDLTGAAQFSPLAIQIAQGFIGASRTDAPDKWGEASPITHVTKDAAPVLFIHGDKDSLVPLPQSETMKAALDKVGVEAELIVVRNGEHGFGGADPQEVGKAYARAVEWLTQHLKSQA